MYSKIIRKSLIFKYIFLLLKYMLFLFVIFLFYIFFKIIFVNKINKIYSNKININTNLIVRPIIQFNDEDNNLTFIVSTDGLVSDDFDKITLNNVKINNDFFEAFSKKVIYENDEIIFKDRPNILFYNNK